MNNHTHIAGLIILLLITGCATDGHKDALAKAEKAIETREYSKAEQFAREAVKNDPDKRKAEIILSYIKYEDEMLPGAFWEEDNEALKYLSGIVHNINVEDQRFNAPVLVLAASRGRTEAVKILLEAGADPNAGTDADGYTALLWAIKNFDEKTEMVRLLLEAGAEVDVESDYEETPLQLAKKYKNPDIESLLKEHGATE